MKSRYAGMHWSSQQCCSATVFRTIVRMRPFLPYAERNFAHLVCILAADATVYFDPWRYASIIAHLPQLAHLLNLVLNELLSSETRVHCTKSRPQQHEWQHEWMPALHIDRAALIGQQGCRPITRAHKRSHLLPGNTKQYNTLSRVASTLLTAEYNICSRTPFALVFKSQTSDKEDMLQDSMMHLTVIHRYTFVGTQYNNQRYGTMSFWPQSLPLMRRIKSTCVMTCWMASIGVAGFNTTPAFTPRSLICSSNQTALLPVFLAPR